MQVRIALIAALALSTALAGSARSQSHLPSSDALVPQTSPGRTGPPSSPLFLGGSVRGPFDVESAPFDNRCLGVQYGWNYFFVTGRGHTTQGDIRRIHQYDLNGNYVQSFSQWTNSTLWGGRDMECDPQTFKLWAGAENGEVSEYQFQPFAGPNGMLVPIQVHSTGVPGTVRALARDPQSGTFFTADFGGPIYEFDLQLGVIRTLPNPGLAIYGMSYDFVSRTLWVWSQNSGSSATNLNRATELDPATGLPTGREFEGLDVTPGIQHVAGGMDIYPDPNNPGALTMVALHQGTPDVIVSYDLRPHVPAPTSYCTSKTSSLGCVPTTTTSQPGTAPEAGGDDYQVLVLNVDAQRNGLIFHGVNGPHAGPFQGGFMCVRAPVQRSQVMNSGGVFNTCGGVLAQTINDPFGLDFVPGTEVWFQGWYRDPFSASTTGLSDAQDVVVAVAAADAEKVKWEIGGGGKGTPIVAVATDSNYRIKNNGPSRIKVRRLDEKGKPIPPEMHMASGQTIDIGVPKGHSLEILDDDGPGNGGANGTYERL
jgi:hypothetical protein